MPVSLYFFNMTFTKSFREIREARAEDRDGTGETKKGGGGVKGEKKSG